MKRKNRREVILKMRIGTGYDVHKLVEGRKLIMGGVEIPHDKGLLGHSDADVLAHAVMDALLGAAALGDIGSHFPDDDPKWKGADSAKLLEAVVAEVSAAGYGVANVDATVVCERPKLRPMVDAIRARVAALVGVDVSSVSVKGKTNERMDDIGAGVGIAAYVAVLLEECPPSAHRTGT